MCKLGDATASGKEGGSTGDWHAESYKAQVAPIGGLLAFFLPMRRLVGRMKTPALLIDAIRLFYLARGELIHN